MQEGQDELLQQELTEIREQVAGALNKLDRLIEALGE